MSGGIVISTVGMFKRFSCLIILANFLANSALMRCPGLCAITFPRMRCPINAKSPITSSNLCLAASLGWCKERLSNTPLGRTAISFLLISLSFPSQAPTKVLMPNSRAIFGINSFPSVHEKERIHLV